MKALIPASQGYKDSNLEMTESESVALPFGDSPLLFFACSSLATNVIILQPSEKINPFFKFFSKKYFVPFYGNNGIIN